MTAENKQILAEIQTLQSSTSSIASTMEEMDTDAHRISDRGNILADISEKMGLTISDIADRLNQFKT